MTKIAFEVGSSSFPVVYHEFALPREVTLDSDTDSVNFPQKFVHKLWIVSVEVFFLE